MVRYHILASLIATALSSAVPADLVERQGSPDTCNRDNLYRCFTASSSIASIYCASLISPVTVTAATVTPTTSVTSTATTSTSTTSPTTSTITVTSTSTQVLIVTSFTGTTTLSTAVSTTATVLNKRAVASGPSCLTRNGVSSTSYAPSRISSACSCLFSRSTTTITPSATPTTSISVATVTTTIVVTTTLSQTVTTSTTTTSTSVSNVLATQTPQPSTQVVGFKKIAGIGNDCVYNRYYDYPDVSNDPTNDYAAGMQQCLQLCASNPQCAFAFFLHFDPNKARGYNGAACILDSLPYDSSYLQCNYVDDRAVAWNKAT